MPHRFSHAIAEGDGISVIAAVDDPESARAAEEQRAEALVVRSNPAHLRDATSLPILWRADVSLDEASAPADAYLIVFDSFDDDADAHQVASVWAWSRGDTAIPPLARYLLHAAKLRQLYRDWQRDDETHEFVAGVRAQVAGLRCF